MNKLIILSTLLIATSGFAKDFKYSAEMECDHCAKMIKSAADKVRKIKTYQADPEKDIILVSFEDKDSGFTKEELKKISWDSGYELKPVD